MQPTPVSSTGRPHGQGSPAGHSPRGRKESDTTERLSLSLLNYSEFNYSASLESDLQTMLMLAQYWDDDDDDLVV